LTFEDPVGDETQTVGAIGGRAVGVFGASALALAIGFITSVVTARALGPEGQGLLATLRTDASVLMSVLAVGAPAAVYYYASLSGERTRPALVGFTVLHATLLTAVAFALVTLAGGAIADSQGVSGEQDLYLLAVVLVPAMYLEYAHLNILRGERLFSRANLLLVAGRIAGLVVTGVLVVALDQGVEGALVAAVAISAVQVAGGLPVLLARGVQLSREVLHRCLSFGARAQLGQLLRMASQRFDLLLLTFFASSSVVGFYAVAQVVAELVLLVPAAIGWILSPYVTAGGASPELTQRLLRINGTLTLIATAGIGAVGPLIVGFGYGDAFRPAIVPLLILLPGIWGFASGELVSFVLAARGRPGTASWLAGYQAAATVGLDLALIPLWGLEGAAVASAIGYGTFGLLSLAVVGRLDQVRPSRILIASRGELREYLSLLRARLSGRGKA